MYPYLATDQVGHNLTTGDLAIIDADGGSTPEPLRAAPVAKAAPAAVPATPPAGRVAPATPVRSVNANPVDFGSMPTSGSSRSWSAAEAAVPVYVGKSNMPTGQMDFGADHWFAARPKKGAGATGSWLGDAGM
jgi:hypothetical protein